MSRKDENEERPKKEERKKFMHKQKARKEEM